MLNSWGKRVAKIGLKALEHFPGLRRHMRNEHPGAIANGTSERPTRRSGAARFSRCAATCAARRRRTSLGGNTIVDGLVFRLGPPGRHCWWWTKSNLDPQMANIGWPAAVGDNARILFRCVLLITNRRR